VNVCYVKLKTNAVELYDLILLLDISELAQNTLNKTWLMQIRENSERDG